MVTFNTTIQRFASQGEKTGWTYIQIPADIVAKFKRPNRQSFKVKGKLDKHKISGVSLMPMRNGDFIMPLNASIRKAIGKKYGAMLEVQIMEDKAPFVFNSDFMECLNDEPTASAFFKTLTPSHQRYFSKWIDDAKTEATRTRRIATAINALSRKYGYGQMLRANKSE